MSDNTINVTERMDRSKGLKTKTARQNRSLSMKERRRKMINYDGELLSWFSTDSYTSSAGV